MFEITPTKQLIFIESFPGKEVFLKDIHELGLIDTVLIDDGKFLFVTTSGLYATLDTNTSTFNCTQDFNYEISDDLVTITLK